MKKYDLTEWGNPILARKLKPVPMPKIKTSAFKKLITDMFFTMKDIGVGLAANQINKDMQLAVMEVRSDHNRGAILPKTVIINPEITEYSEEKVDSWEGCLSCRGVRGMAERSKWIKVRYTDESGREQDRYVEGFPAIVFQHEIDHLNGVCYAERIKSLKNLITEGEYRKMVAKTKKGKKRS